MGGWWPSHWVPSCEQSVGGRQHQEEALCLQPQLPWYVPTPGWGPCLLGGSSECVEPPRGASTAVAAGAVSCWSIYSCALSGSGAGLHGGADELREAAV